jgi:hypothetical protein
VTYYKATRLDGMDFRTGTIKYEVGKRVRPHPTLEQRSICGPGYLHAANHAAMTLIGGSWPCRLFEVTGTPAAGFDDDHRYKGGFKELRVVRELDAYLALGPNGEAVAGIIDRAGRLTFDEVQKLNAAWGAARDAARGAAWDAAWNAAWDAAWGAARDAAWGAARDAARGAAWDAARGAAWDVGDAVLAVVTRDIISTEQFDRLYGPWAKIIDGAE